MAEIYKAVEELKKHGCYECAVGSESPTKCEWDCKYKDAYTMAINSLEKQIPKKPYYEGDGYADGYMVYDTWICPNCGKHYEVDYDNYKYCPECGQRLDLEEV